MRYLFTFLFSLFLSEIFSQPTYISVEGTIKGSNGSQAVFTTIRAKHNRNTTCAYSDGRFKLNGVKIGDTLLFSNIGYRESYFVVDRKYNKLDFTLVNDTLKTSIKMPLAFINFNFNSAYFGSKELLPIKFSETLSVVLDEQRPDENKIFTKVEIMPGFKIIKQVFDESLDSMINKLPKKYKPKKNGTVNVYYWIRSDHKIEVTNIESPYTGEVNNLFSALFGNVFSIYPALQNGRNIGVFCVTKFGVDVNKDKSILIKILTN